MYDKDEAKRVSLVVDDRIEILAAWLCDAAKTGMKRGLADTPVGKRAYQLLGGNLAVVAETCQVDEADLARTRKEFRQLTGTDYLLDFASKYDDYVWELAINTLGNPLSGKLRRLLYPLYTQV